MNKRGFTLIELLVVIAIIGILSGVVVVSMSGAQNSAKDARIRSAMDQLRSSAELFRISQSPMTYDGFTASTEAILLINDIKDQSPAGTIATGVPTASAYCMSTALNAGGFLCMDSTGKVAATECTAAACP